jgi:hypothetical protein
MKAEGDYLGVGDQGEEGRVNVIKIHSIEVTVKPIILYN